MSKVILKELSRLVEHNVISEETASKIKAFYDTKTQESSNRLLMVFGIVGALLIGLGIILIVAHNWDEFPRSLKLFFAFLPMVIGQLACGYFLFRMPQTQNWKEAASVFLFFAIATSISIVSQVYNIEGSLAGFLLTWMVLTLPLIYTMKSSTTSLLFLLGITWYACEQSYFSYPTGIAWWYWPLLMAALPHYYSLSKSPGNFFNVHSWIIALSIIICLGSLSKNHGIILLITYISLLSAYVSLGQLKPYSEQRLIANAFLIVGSLGVIVIMLSLSFRWTWEVIQEHNFTGLLASQEFIASIAILILAAFLLFKNLLHKPWMAINLKSYSFIPFIIIFFIGISSTIVPQILINIALFVLAVFTVMDGARTNRLGILNYGLLILTALIICRFFDTNMSFILRGLLFVAVGAGFFTMNFYMIKKRKNIV